MELAHEPNPQATPIARIQQALVSRGVDWAALRLSDLWPMDQFHVGESSATLALARRVGLQRGSRVLDVGGGLGGPARILAGEFGCRVTVVEKERQYAETAEALNQKTNLAAQISVECRCISSCDFPRGSFDAVWCQHVSMNVNDKEAFFRDLCRVLRPPGSMAIHTITRGANGAPRFPLPWARHPPESSLLSADELRFLLEDVGFEEIEWLDLTEASLNWLREKRAAAKAQRSTFPDPLQILFGSEGAEMTENLIHGLEEWRLEVVQGVLGLR
jgi:cyclopropane fatty-acyl-phospholipid synthase-like methyltransferase